MKTNAGGHESAAPHSPRRARVRPNVSSALLVSVGAILGRRAGRPRRREGGAGALYGISFVDPAWSAAIVDPSTALRAD
jgi:hypothetical protein